MLINSNSQIVHWTVHITVHSAQCTLHNAHYMQHSRVRDSARLDIYRGTLKGIQSAQAKFCHKCPYLVSHDDKTVAGGCN